MTDGIILMQNPVLADKPLADLRGCTPNVMADTRSQNTDDLLCLFVRNSQPSAR